MNHSETLRLYRESPDRFVFPFQIKERDKTRDIVTYNKADALGGTLRRAHEWVLDEFLKNFAQRNLHSYAYHKGVRCLDALSDHLRSNHFIKLDIHHFFESITEEAFFAHGGEFNAYWKENLSGCFYKGALSIGFVTSPALSDYFMRGFDAEMEEYLSSHPGLHYSRYSDDILLSSEIDLLAVNEFFAFLATRLAALGLEINEKKTRRVSLDLESHNSISFLGLNLSKADEEENKITVSKRYILFLLKLIAKERGYVAPCFGLENEIRSRVAYLAYSSPVSFDRFQRKHVARFGEPYFFLPKETPKRLAAAEASGLPDFARYAKSFTLNIHGSAHTDVDVRVVKDGVVLERCLLQTGEVAELPPFVESINRDAFAGKGFLRSVKMPKRLKHIGDRAFSRCAELTELSLPSSLRYIGQLAFQGTAIPLLEVPGKCNLGFKAAFAQSGVEEIRFGEGIKEISSQAAKECKKLKRIALPEGLETIGAHAFENCPRLGEPSFPSTLIGVEEYAFADDLSLKGLSFPEGVVSVGPFAFARCLKLKRVELPSTLTAISPTAFSGCVNLEEIVVSPNNPAYESGPNHSYLLEKATGILLYSRDGSIPEGTRVLGPMLFSGQALKEIDIPEGVVALGEALFQDCRYLRRVELPSTLNAIGRAAFCRCLSLQEIAIPASVTVIPSSCFEGDARLRHLSLPQGTTRIGEHAFLGCSRLELDLPEGLTELGGRAFEGCPLTRLSLPKGLTKVHPLSFFGLSKTLKEIHVDPGNPAFVHDGAENVLVLARNGLLLLGIGGAKVPLGTVRIGAHAFAYNKDLTSLELPITVRSIEEGAFEGCDKLQSITLPAVAKIGAKAFLRAASLTHIDLPDTLTSLGSNAFSRSGLAKLDLPLSLTELKPQSLAGLSEVEEFSLPGHLALPEGNALFPKLRKVRVTSPSDLYVEDLGHASLCRSGRDHYYSLFLGSSEDKDLPQVMAIDNYAFAGNEGLKNLIVPDSVERIGLYAFKGCPNLETVVFLGGNEEKALRIEPGAFAYCPKLRSVDFGAGRIAYVGEAAFKGCGSLATLKNTGSIATVGKTAFFATALSALSLPNANTICAGAFARCEKLERVEFSPKLESLRSYAFAGSGLKEVSLKDCATLTKMDHGVFRDCKQLKTIVLPEGLTSIGSEFAHGCVELTSCALPSTVTKILHHAFSCCPKLTFGQENGDWLPESLTSLRSYAFAGDKAIQAVCFPSKLGELSSLAFFESGLKRFSIAEDNETYVQVGDALYCREAPTAAAFALPGATLEKGTERLNPYLAYAVSLDLGNLPEELTELALEGYVEETALPSLPVHVKELRGDIASVALSPSDGVYAFPDGLAYLHLRYIDLSQVKELRFGALNYLNIAGFRFQKGKRLEAIHVAPNFPKFEDMGGRALVQKSSKKLLLGLPSGEIPEGVRSIDDGAFTHVHAKTVTVPEGVDSLGSRFLEDSTVGTLRLPASLDSIGALFGFNASIGRIEVAEGNPFFRVEGGVALIEVKSNALLYLAQGEAIPEGVTCLNEKCLARQDAHYACLSLPSTLGKMLTLGENVTVDEFTVAEESPYFCDLGLGAVFDKDDKDVLLLSGTRSKLPPSLRQIKPHAFSCASEGYALALGPKATYLPRSLFRDRLFGSVSVDKDNPVYASVNGVALVLKKSNYLVALAKGASLPEGVKVLKPAFERFDLLAKAEDQGFAKDLAPKPSGPRFREANPWGSSSGDDLPF